MTESKTAFLSGYTDDPEERMRLSHMLDCLQACEKRNFPTATAFLTPREQMLCRKLLETEVYGSHAPMHAFFGGHESAERAVLAFVPDWLTPEDYFAGEDSPIAALRMQNREAGLSARDALTHRDFLGALMGAGLRRDAVGDLFVREDGCDCVLLRSVLPYVESQVVQAGRASLSITPIPLSELQVPAPKVKEIRDTVASLRLDAVLGAAFSQPRSKAADAIRAGLVTAAHRVCTKPDAPVQEGDSLTWKGQGKAVLQEIGGLSRKGRITLRILRYL